LEMPCLKERGLFALPTEGDGKLVTLVVSCWSFRSLFASCQMHIDPF
jgi:hypothetical protein